jgi:hypothetical protein
LFAQDAAVRAGKLIIAIEGAGDYYERSFYLPSARCGSLADFVDAPDECSVLR